MLKKTTFKRGGIHPLDKKELSRTREIEVLPLPSTLVVAMSQHLGAPATVIVEKGQRVEKGEVIGKASSFVSSNVHSPVRGEVVEIKKTLLATGVISDSVVIKCDEEQPELFTESFDWKSMSKEEILSIIKECGIVGMGGATFPTSVKFAIPEGKKVEYVVVNAVECEPYITCDYRIMIERTDALLDGLMIIKKAIEPEKMVIAIEENKMDAALIIEERIKELGYPIFVQPLKMKYPQGDEKQLLYAVTKRTIPSGKLPLDIGCIVCNTSSVNAIYEAVKYHKPLIERVVTVTGENIKNPKNLLCPIGASLSDLFSYCDGIEEDGAELISGGPMMGFDIPSLDIPLTKGTNGLLCMKKKEKEKTYPCMNCGRCVSHCPMGLTPNRMFRLIQNGEYKEAMKIGLMDCKECGCCAYSCPSHIELVQGFKKGKKLGREKK